MPFRQGGGVGPSCPFAGFLCTRGKRRDVWDVMGRDFGHNKHEADASVSGGHACLYLFWLFDIIHLIFFFACFPGLRYILCFCSFLSVSSILHKNDVGM